MNNEMEKTTGKQRIKQDLKDLMRLFRKTTKYERAGQHSFRQCLLSTMARVGIACLDRKDLNSL